MVSRPSRGMLQCWEYIRKMFHSFVPVCTVRIWRRYGKGLWPLLSPDALSLPLHNTKPSDHIFLERDSNHKSQLLSTERQFCINSEPVCLVCCVYRNWNNSSKSWNFIFHLPFSFVPLMSFYLSHFHILFLSLLYLGSVRLVEFPANLLFWEACCCCVTTHYISYFPLFIIILHLNWTRILAVV
jgi:hypothetical protein